jgi:DNA polymerase
MIEAINLKREDVYICNVVKCRPPQNRVPMEEEAEACLPFLRQQVAIIRPKIIVCLGATAARYIINRDIRITRDRGKWYEKGGFQMIATFHPSALLRDPDKKKDAWEDFKALKEKYEEMQGISKE